MKIVPLAVIRLINAGDRQGHAEEGIGRTPLDSQLPLPCKLCDFGQMT